MKTMVIPDGRRTTISVGAEHMDRIRMIAAEATILNGRRIHVQVVTDLLIEHAIARLGMTAATFVVTSLEGEGEVDVNGGEE
jgi:hypothetical protein